MEVLIIIVILIIICSLFKEQESNNAGINFNSNPQSSKNADISF